MVFELSIISKSLCMIEPMRPFKSPPVSELSLERVLYALSDPLRLQVVQQLSAVAEASCGDLNGGRPKSSMSHHFRVLRDAGLIRTQTVGTSHINTLRRSELDGRFPGLLDAILAQDA